MPTLYITHKTFLKQHPYSSDDLRSGYLKRLEAETKLEVESYNLESSGHYKLVLSKKAIWGPTAYVWNEHISVDHSSTDASPKKYPKYLSASQNAINLIKEFEGCRLEAYLCASNVWTIGYGRTEGIYQGMRITQHEAESYLREDIYKYENYVRDHVSVPITQNQFDALVSWVYNCGNYALQESTGLRRLNSGDYKGSWEAFAWFNKGSNGTLSGLVRRRAAEGKLYNKE